jgi:saccharopine dehydrogenase (NADP+, L-glutamate forming)
MAEQMKILVLGSGMVAPPCVEYLSRNTKNGITVGTCCVELLGPDFELG